MPAYKMTQIPVTDEIEQAIGIRPTEAWMGRDLVCIMESEEQIVTAAPNMERVKNWMACFCILLQKALHMTVFPVLLLQRCMWRKMLYAEVGTVILFPFGLKSWVTKKLRLDKVPEGEALFTAKITETV